MSIDELKYKESKLRECFKRKLSMLDVEGDNDYATVKCIKTYGVLWHLTHQLLMAEEHETTDNKPEVGNTRSVTTADTMDIQATGLRMAT